MSDGTAVGRLHLADTRPEPIDADAGQVSAAFTAVAGERSALADRLRAAGRNDEADIMAVTALIAADPALADAAVAAVRAGADAPSAVRKAAEEQASVLAALPSQELADRAADVRQVGQAVLEHLTGRAAPPPPAGDFILVRREVAAVDLIELSDHGLVAAVSVTGGASSHAAIVARGLGLPMLTGADPAVLGMATGTLAVLDGGSGQLICDPGRLELAAARSGLPDPGRGESRDAALAAPVPAVTADGEPVTMLCNVASAAETRRGLSAGAVGVGLLRTEIPFTSVPAWPTRAQQEQHLRPILAQLAGRPATVRLLDFSGDKVPPFLSPAASGLSALLAQPAALRDQLTAVLAAGRDTGLSILVPMVRTLDEVTAVREALAQAAGAAGCPVPPLGIMVEVAATAAIADQFAGAVDFFSIGTNDLTGQVLGLGRADPAAGPALAADPAVLLLIARVVTAAEAAGISVSVCGDAAADPLALPLLIGLGVRTVSVPAAAVGRVRDQVAKLDARHCATLAAAALGASSAADAWDLVRGAGYA